MASMEFDNETAERLEAMYLGHDVIAQRKDTLERLALKSGQNVLDIGSGPGFLCQEMAEIVGSSGRVRGIDISPVMVDRARERNSLDWLSYSQADATALPEPDQAYDVVVSTQVAEYVPDISGFCNEAFRILKPAGRGIIMATDWDTVAWHSDDPARMNRILEAFRPHCANSRLPRTLGMHLSQAGFTVTGISAFPIINDTWEPGCYSRQTTPFIAEYVRGQNNIKETEILAWENELPELSSQGRYFFLSSRIQFEITRPQ